jgi:ferredoxin
MNISGIRQEYAKLMNAYDQEVPEREQYYSDSRCMGGNMVRTTIFCFTGTGNSLSVAKGIASGFSDAHIIQICRAHMPQTGTVYPGNVGFVFPVYYFGVPHMVREYVRALDMEKGTYVFGVATFGGMAGLAFDLLADDLALKGIKLRAAFPVLMPGNCQVMYPPQAEAEQQERFRNAQEKIGEIIRCVDAGKDLPVPKPNIFARGFMRLFYSRLKPHGRARNFHADEKCTGCGTCARICPAGNITLQEKKPLWGDQCEFCLACMQWCPAEAIQYANKTQKRGRYHNPDIHVKELFRY